MNYTSRTEEEQATLEHLPAGPYFYDDTPHLSTARYSITGFEPREMEDKRSLDMHSAQDNLYFYNLNKKEDRAINIGQI